MSTVLWYKNPDKPLMADLLARIRSDGPLRSRDLESNTVKAVGWWDWKPTKKALEQLYMQGDLMVSRREGFQKVYDLTERVLPDHINSQVPSVEEFARHLLEQQLGCHGLVSLKGLTYLRRNPELRQAIKTLVNDRLAQGILEQVQLGDGEIFVLEAGAFECRLPRQNNRMLILSPFDNSVIQRERLKSLFQYDYQIECYVPAPKRQYGYFCLPVLYCGEFIGRMDCKAHRKDRHLEIKSLFFEKSFEQQLTQQSIDQDALVTAFIDGITPFSQFQNCNRVSLTNVQPEYLAQPLRSALESLG